jgi:hypothetical protein
MNLWVLFTFEILNIPFYKKKNRFDWLIWCSDNFFNDRLGFTGGGEAKPIFIKQLKFYPTVFKTCHQFHMEIQVRNMLNILHQRIDLPHFQSIFWTT